MEGVLPFRELSLSATEKEKLHHSAEALRTKLDELGY
jgi:malate/lactate dehydrogenase